MARRRVDILAGSDVTTGNSEKSRVAVEIFRRPGGVQGSLVRVVPQGTTGWENEPDETLWVEYDPT